MLLGSLAMTIYFVHHAISGSHGIDSRVRVLDRLSDVENEITVLGSVRDRYLGLVGLLALEPPDRDIVEEIARDMLGMVYPGEVVVR